MSVSEARAICWKNGHGEVRYQPSYGEGPKERRLFENPYGDPRNDVWLAKVRADEWHHLHFVVGRYANAKTYLTQTEALAIAVKQANRAADSDWKECNE